MGVIHLRWSTLFNLSELEFVPGMPKELLLSDELIQAISWLTAATGHDRKLLRCTEQGALLVADPWSNLVSIETDVLYPASAAADSFTATVANKGVLIATSTQIIKASIVRIAGGTPEVIYIPPAWDHFVPNPVYSITANVVPDPGGTASYVGITAFN